MADAIPGVYTEFYRDSDVASTGDNHRCMLPAYVAPGCPAPIGVPFRCDSGAQVAAYTGGTWSHASRLYAAARAGDPSAEVWILPLAAPSGGTKTTRLLKFAAEPTYDSSKGWLVGSATAAAQASDCMIDIAGQVVTFGFLAAETWAQIATRAQAALAEVSDLIVVPTVASETVTLTDRHAGELGNDLPVRVSFSNVSCGAAVIFGTVTLATNASADGSVTLTDGIQSGVAAFSNGDAPADVSPDFRDAINANCAVRAAGADPATGVVTLYYRSDRWARQHTTSITGAGMTSTLAAGTVGSGAPSLTAGLTYLAGDQAYKAWGLFFSDASNLGSVAAHVIAQDRSPIEKGQMAFACISSALPGTSLITSTTPSLGTTELMCVLHYQGATVRAGEIAARVAAVVAATEDHGRNYNGLRLYGSDAQPLAVPHRADRSGRTAWANGLTAGYAPVAVDVANRAYVVSARTTFKASNNVTAKLKKWSGALLPIYFRASLKERLHSLFFQPGNGKSLKAHGVPRTDRGTVPKGVRSEVLALIAEWGAQDYFDEGRDIDSAVRAEISASPNSIKVKLPFRSVSDLDRIDAEAYAA